MSTVNGIIIIFVLIKILFMFWVSLEIVKGAMGKKEQISSDYMLQFYMRIVILQGDIKDKYPMLPGP